MNLVFTIIILLCGIGIVINEIIERKNMAELNIKNVEKKAQQLINDYEKGGMFVDAFFWQNVLKLMREKYEPQAGAGRSILLKMNMAPIVIGGKSRKIKISAAKHGGGSHPNGAGGGATQG